MADDFWGEDEWASFERDAKDRVMIIATHNPDNGDGWEREGEEHEYFQKFSEARAAPFAINVVFYLMTH